MWHAPWQQRQQAKIDRALNHLEKAPPAWGASPDYGHLTLACALGYLDFRHEGKWRAGHPKLVAWLDQFAAAVPAFEETRPKLAHSRSSADPQRDERGERWEPSSYIAPARDSHWALRPRIALTRVPG